MYDVYSGNIWATEVLSGIDITSVYYLDRNNQVSDDGTGISTWLLLCGDLEDEVIGTVTESLFSCVHSLSKASVTKMLAIFPFRYLLDPRNRSVTSVTGIVSLASRFTSYSTDEIDTLDGISNLSSCSRWSTTKVYSITRSISGPLWLNRRP